MGRRCGSRGFDFPFSTLNKKAKKSVMSALCLTWPIDASRGGLAGWKGWEREREKRARYGERGMVVFGLDYACAHIIILAEISSGNLRPIQADFVTERVIREVLV